MSSIETAQPEFSTDLHLIPFQKNNNLNRVPEMGIVVFSRIFWLSTLAEAKVIGIAKNITDKIFIDLTLGGTKKSQNWLTFSNIPSFSFMLRSND